MHCWRCRAFKIQRSCHSQAQSSPRSHRQARDLWLPLQFIKRHHSSGPPLHSRCPPLFIKGYLAIKFSSLFTKLSSVYLFWFYIVQKKHFFSRSLLFLFFVFLPGFSQSPGRSLGSCLKFFFFFSSLLLLLKSKTKA